MTDQTTKYIGTCFIGVVGSDIEIGYCRDSIENLMRRPGDEMRFTRATKGYEARQSHLNNFIESKHDFLFLMDADQLFPAHSLERLRSHGLPYVSGLYMRRNLEVIAPVWYRPWDGKWPMEPWVGSIKRGVLHEIGASGWGCMLIHREVILKVRSMLKGELEVLEDDMDIFPYDLKRIFGALNGLRALVEEAPTRSTLLPALNHHVKILEEEIRPLRLDREIVGSDIRFPFFAYKAGYKLMGDPEVRAGHNTFYPLSPDNYDQFSEEQREKAYQDQHDYVLSERKKLKERQKEIVP